VAALTWQIGARKKGIEKMSNQAEPVIGQHATCQMCDAEIIFIGPYWDHVGEDKPRHPALPKGEAETEEEVIEPHMAIRSVMFDLMARKAEWKDKSDPYGVAPHIGALIAALQQALKDLRHYNDMKKALAVLKNLD